MPHISETAGGKPVLPGMLWLPHLSPCGGGLASGSVKRNSLV